MLFVLVPAASGATPGDQAAPAPSKAAGTDDESLGKGFRDAYGKEQSRDGASRDGAKDGGESRSSGGMGRALVGFALVLALIFAVHWLLRKYADGKQGALGAQGSLDAIEVMATTPLAPNRSLHLVRVGGELVLIGATDQSINQLGRVDGQQLSVVAGNSGDQAFQQQLQGALTGTSLPRTGTGDDTFLRKFVSNLQMMTAR